MRATGSATGRDALSFSVRAWQVGISSRRAECLQANMSDRLHFDATLVDRPSIIPLAPLEVMNPIKKRKVDWKKLSL